MQKKEVFNYEYVSTLSMIDLVVALSIVHESTRGMLSLCEGLVLLSVNKARSEFEVVIGAHHAETPQASYGLEIKIAVYDLKELCWLWGMRKCA